MGSSGVRYAKKNNTVDSVGVGFGSCLTALVSPYVTLRKLRQDSNVIVKRPASSKFDVPSSPSTSAEFSLSV